MALVRVDPLDRRVRFIWQADPNAVPSGYARRPEDPPPPKRLVAVVDPAEQTTKLSYDPAGNVIGLREPDGVESKWRYDLLGRCLVEVDGRGSREERQYDALGRVCQVRERDGNIREIEYDAEGNIVRARDKLHDVAFTYGGMNRVTSRTEAGAAIRLQYDREDRLVSVENEHHEVMRFELGPTGEVE